MLKLNDEIDETEINAANIINSREVIEPISRYEKKIKTQHKRVIEYIAKLGKIFKKFKETKKFL